MKLEMAGAQRLGLADLQELSVRPPDALSCGYKTRAERDGRVLT